MTSDPAPPPDLAVLAAVVSRQSADLGVYADFLATALAGALPPDQIQVERKRRLFGNDDNAPVISVQVRIGDHTYGLSRKKPGAPAVTTVAHTVSGIVLSTKTVPLGDWSQQLAAALTQLSETNADAAATLSRITRFTV